jgi:energy-coupling factor transporter ATP-binding protein EcfA2
MIKTLTITKTDSRYMPPIVDKILQDPVQFEQSNLIIGDNGTGKSTFLEAVLFGVEPDYWESRKARPGRINMDRSKIRHFLWKESEGNITMEWDPSWIVIYHYGLDLYRGEITQRKFGSDGEGALYELLLYTSDLNSKDPTKGKGSARGDEILLFNSSITKRFANGEDLGLTLKKPAILICDEPESSLSRNRVLALTNYFARWLEEGNQLIVASNHPWIIDILAPVSKVFDLDRI